jgi:hypothetical protein
MIKLHYKGHQFERLDVELKQYLEKLPHTKLQGPSGTYLSYIWQLEDKEAVWLELKHPEQINGHQIA